MALDTSAVNSETKDELADSFNATVNTFTKYTKNKDGKDERISVGGDGEITVTGGDECATTTPTSGELDPDNLVPGKELGRGASSYVQMVSDKRTGKKLALKVLNVFDKKRRPVQPLRKCDSGTNHLRSHPKCPFLPSCSRLSDALPNILAAFLAELSSFTAMSCIRAISRSLHCSLMIASNAVVGRVNTSQ